MNEPGFSVVVNRLLDILNDLDEFGRPKVKLPDCPKCDEDELGVIHADLILCYSCGWKIEGKPVRTPLSGEIDKLLTETLGKRCPKCGGMMVHSRLRGFAAITAFESAGHERATGASLSARP